MPSAVLFALKRPVSVPLNERAAWSVKETAQAFGVSSRLIVRMIANGTMPSSKMGRRTVIDPEAARRAIFGDSTPAA